MRVVRGAQAWSNRRLANDIRRIGPGRVKDPSTHFDFDAWCELARRDPPAFFRARQRAITEFIDAHPQVREKLLVLQAQIDSLRASAGTPALALQGIVGMLDDHLAALSGHLSQLREETERFNQTLNRRR